MTLFVNACVGSQSRTEQIARAYLHGYTDFTELVLDNLYLEPLDAGMLRNRSDCIALRFVWEMAACKELKNIPISAMGGIETWRDAVEFLLLGANHVQITTAVMQYGARIIDDLLEGLTCYLQEKALTSVSQLQGLGVENVTALDQLERDTVLLPKFLRDACIGCGRCFLSCRDGGHEAITMQGGKPVMNPKKCVGCHLCILVCPQKAIRSSGRRI